MKVWTNAAIGTYVTLKAEKPFWGEERSVQTTKTGEWETLTFDFTNAPTDMNVLAFMFDFVAGSSNVGDGSAGSTFYFDEVKYANVPLYTTEHNASMNYELYPNPTQNQWTLRNTSGKMLCGYIFNSSGQLYETLDFNDQEIINIDASQYPSGTYVLKITYTSREETLKLFKL
jgi:hypothetical protein